MTNEEIDSYLAEEEEEEEPPGTLPRSKTPPHWPTLSPAHRCGLHAAHARAHQHHHGRKKNSVAEVKVGLEGVVVEVEVAGALTVVEVEVAGAITVAEVREGAV